MSDDVVDNQVVDRRDLDELADKLRLATVRLRLERLVIGWSSSSSSGRCSRAASRTSGATLPARHRR